MATTAHDVAALLIEEQHAAGHTIDKMQLEKWLYLVQGAHLAFWGERAFREPLLAYRNGPVVRVVEETYRNAAPGAAPLDRPLGGNPGRVAAEVVDTVRTVLRHFGTWTGPALEQFVKAPDAPWNIVRGGLPPSASSHDEIPLDIVCRWFIDHGIDPDPEQLVEPTDEERASASRERQAGVYALTGALGVSPEEERIARGALDRIEARRQRDR